VITGIKLPDLLHITEKGLFDRGRREVIIAIHFGSITDVFPNLLVSDLLLYLDYVLRNLICENTLEFIVDVVLSAEFI